MKPHVNSVIVGVTAAAVTLILIRQPLFALVNGLIGVLMSEMVRQARSK